MFEELVALERRRQNEKWGEQNHSFFIWLAILGEEFGELQKACLEQFFNRYYSGSPQRVEKELVEVAAVAKAMWESLKRQNIL